MRSMEYVDNTEVLRSLAKKLNPPLVTLLSSEPEVGHHVRGKGAGERIEINSP